MSKVLVDRDRVVESMCLTWRHDFGLDKLEGCDFCSGMTDKEREHLRGQMGKLFDHHFAPALSAVTAELDAALAENARLIEDRARFPDKPDDIGNMIRAHIGNLKIGKEQAESYARKWSAEADLLRKDAERWRYVSLQGDDTHWLNLLRVDLEDFGGNINSAVDALIDGGTPATAAKEA